MDRAAADHQRRPRDAAVGQAPGSPAAGARPDGPDSDDFWEWFDAPVEAPEQPRRSAGAPVTTARGRAVAAGFGWAAVIAALVVTSLLTLPPLAGMQVRTVYSGSMAPAIKAGDAVILRPVLSADLRRGDVVAYRPPHDPTVLITHRVDGIRYETTGAGGYGEFVVTTKGDANRSLDQPWRAAPNDTFGKVVLTLPKLGYVLNFLSGTKGKLLALVALVTFLVAGSASRRRAQRAAEAVGAAPS